MIIVCINLKFAYQTETSLCQLFLSFENHDDWIKQIFLLPDKIVQTKNVLYFT